MWQPVTVPDGETIHWRLGAFSLWLRRAGPEWLLAANNDPTATGFIIDHLRPPAELVWLRRVAPDTTPTIRMVPRLPDRPVISRPAQPLALLPGTDCRFFISVPAFISVQLVASGQLLEEFPAETLIKSWSGSVIDGEACYALHTTARRDPAELHPAPQRIVCPVLLRNQSAENLPFNRLTLPVSALGVYRGETRLWTNSVEVAILGMDNWTRPKAEAGPPTWDHAVEQLGQPRQLAPPGSPFRPLISELKQHLLSF